MVRLNIVYDLLQKTKLSSNNEIVQPTSKVYFLICNSCYWCASYFGIDDVKSLSGSLTHALNCHICDSRNTELMPISTDELFMNEYNVTRGMEIEFYRSNNIVIRRHSAREFQMHQVPI
jgi:hypothetical protein